jgi:hypothetical protein
MTVHPTAQGRPRKSDTFIKSGAQDLLPVMDDGSGSWVRVERDETTHFRLTEVSFCKNRNMGKQVHRNQPLGNYRYLQPNTKTMYGASSSGRVADPKDPPTI